MSALDDAHAHATLEWQQRELIRKSLHLGYAQLLAGTLRRDPMDVRMISVLQLATRRTRAAWPIGWRFG
jgi:hypothetical protein